MRPFRFLAALTLIAGLSATAALAEDDGGRDPSVDQYVVCSAIIESCLAACSTLSDKGGVLTLGISASCNARTPIGSA